MKPLLLTLLFVALSLAGFAQDDIKTNQEKPYQTKTFSGGFSTVRTETSGGSITVEGSSRTDIEVAMYVRANNGNDRLSADEIADRLKDYEISIRPDGNTLLVRARSRSNSFMNWKRSLSISFTILTPRNMATDLETSGGSIRLSHLTGSEKLATSGGSLRLNDLEGDIQGRTSGGSISVTDCRKQRTTDRIDLETSGGSINVSRAAGTMRLETSGGSIKLNDLTGKIKAETSGGSVVGGNIDGELITGTSGGSIRLNRIAGSIEAETSSGSVEVELVRVGDYVKLTTSSGSVRVHMPLDKGLDLDLRGDKVTTTTLSNFSGNAEKDRVKGRLNGGGIPVRLSASSGNVYLNQ